MSSDGLVQGCYVHGLFADDGFVLDNGPGSQTLNLRGLGANQTLILVDGRRMPGSQMNGNFSTPTLGCPKLHC